MAIEIVPRRPLLNKDEPSAVLDIAVHGMKQATRFGPGSPYMFEAHSLDFRLGAWLRRHRADDDYDGVFAHVPNHSESRILPAENDLKTVAPNAKTFTMGWVRIGELADGAGVNTKTVRYYESIGLMGEPARTAAGYRDYGHESLERLVFIRDAQATGLTLAEIQSVIELKDSGSSSCEHTRSLLKQHLDDLDSQIVRLQAAREELINLFDGSAALDPSSCTDPNRCQVIGAARNRA